MLTIITNSLWRVKNFNTFLNHQKIYCPQSLSDVGFQDDCRQQKSAKQKST